MASYQTQLAFLDDLRPASATLSAAVIGSPIAHGHLQQIQLNQARAMPGVRAVLTAVDIPGENRLETPFESAVLLAHGPIRYRGQPIGLVVADTPEQARAAAAAVRFEMVELTPVTTVAEAFSMGQMLAPPRTIQNGFPHRRWKRADHLFEDRLTIGAQDHAYAETQGALAMPDEDGCLRVLAATQTPAVLQQAVASVLHLPHNRLNVETVRLGGSFGGKTHQSIAWAALAALAAFHLNAPVKLVLNREEDFNLTGKRPACVVDFQIALTSELKIDAYKATFYLDAGAFADLIPTVAEDILLHLNSAYDLPNILGSVFCCRTNLPPNTCNRASGAAIAALAIETAIAKAAETMKREAVEIQGRNLLSLNEYFPYGQQATRCTIEQTFSQACQETLGKEITAVRRFNAKHPYLRRGLAVMPICSGIPYTDSRAVSARAGIHIYSDGSIVIRSDSVDTGMGEHEKLRLVTANILGVPGENIRILPANTAYQTELATHPLPPSLDLSAKALADACLKIRQTLLENAAAMLRNASPAQLKFENGRILFDEKPTRLYLPDVAAACYDKGQPLSETGLISMPFVYYDARTEDGQPFAYHVYGTAVCKVTLDSRNGSFKIDHFRVVHDAGTSIHPELDRTLIEGGIMMATGWLTSETVIFDRQGRLLTTQLLSAGLPDYTSVPQDWQIEFLDTKPEPFGLEGSKTVDDPPFLYGIAVYLALRQALLTAGVQIPPPYQTPLTPACILAALQDAV